jgi:NAD(P)H-dependent nitrite reductase small subunit
MPSWIPIARSDELAPGHCRSILAGDRDVALFNVDGSFFALDNACPHRGGPLGEGDLKGHLVFCPLHAWQFDVRNGVCPVSESVKAEPIPVRVVDGVIHVQL